MIEDNIEKIRNDAIAEIKEKTKRNPRYLHPMNKERQEWAYKYVYKYVYKYAYEKTQIC